MTIQPFILFEKKFIPRLRQLKKDFLVAQSYSRGMDVFAPEKTSILISSYDDQGLAEIHLKAIRDDKYSAIINLAHAKHFEKLLSMLQADSPYTLYWSVVKDAAQLEKHLNQRFADNMRRYIQKHTSWRIGGKDSVEPTFEVTFGELFVNLKWRTQRQRVKFEEIEKS
jgi:hypothetical protein